MTTATMLRCSRCPAEFADRPSFLAHWAAVHPWTTNPVAYSSEWALPQVAAPGLDEEAQTYQPPVPDLHTQLEDLLLEVRQDEKREDVLDRIDRAVRQLNAEEAVRRRREK